MKIWVLLAIAGLLLVWSLSRERFEATASIKAPPYDATEESRIRKMMSKADLDLISAELKKLSGGAASDEMMEEQARNMPPSMVSSFFHRVYTPATAPITEADITKFVGAWPHFSQELKDAIKRLLKAYFIDQGASRAEKTGYSAILTSMGQEPGYSAPQGTTTATMNAAPLSEPTGLSSLIGPAAAGGGLSALTGPAVPGGGLGTGTGSSTGGSSISSMGPTSGNSGTRSKQVFGPVFTAQGPSAGGPTADSSRTNRYPELMGGMTDTSTRIEGVGVVDPSKNWKLAQDGSLPSEDSLGATGASKFFPTSRSPGDMDLIPDPYRLSRNFSTASYSSKTEPAPFLTDFSAFLK